MRTRRRTVLIVALSITLLSGAAWAEQERTTLEGYVFNKWTGVPLQGAQIFVFTLTSDLALTNQYVTDSNGFYSIQVSGPIFGASVFCSWSRGSARSDIHTPSGGVGLIERNAYLSVPGRRSFSRCGEIVSRRLPLN